MVSMTSSVQNRHSWRVLAVQISVLLVFALMPVWYRLPDALPLITPLYITQSLVALAAALTVCVWFAVGMPGFAVFIRDRVRVGWALLLLILVLWMYASSGWAFMRDREPELALNTTVQFAVVALFALVTACAGPSPRAVIAALAVGIVWNTLLAGGQVALQGSLGLAALGEFPLDPARSGVSVIQSGELRWLRPYGLLPHPNPLAGFFAVALLGLAGAIVMWRGRWWGTVLLLALFAGGLWAFLLTFSRAAWLGFAAGGFVVLPILFRGRWFNRNLAALIALSVGVGALFLALYFPLILTRTGAGQESTELFSVAERAALTGAAYDVIRELPWTGVGAGNFPWRASYYFFDADIPLRGNNVHHVLLTAWVELGAVGLALTVGALVLGIEAALRRLRESARDDLLLRGALLGGFMALVVVGLFDHYPWTMPQFQLLWWGGLAVAMRPEL